MMKPGRKRICPMCHVFIDWCINSPNHKFLWVFLHLFGHFIIPVHFCSPLPSRSFSIFPASGLRWFWISVFFPPNFWRRGKGVLCPDSYLWSTDEVRRCARGKFLWTRVDWIE